MQANNAPDTTNANQTPTPAAGKEMDKEVIALAHTQAEHDMEEDAELTGPGPNDDLDEEESARLSKDTPTPII